jgi:hypothetical protein
MGVSKVSAIFFSVVCVFGAVGLIHSEESTGTVFSFDPLTVELSFDGTLANVNHGDKLLAPPLNYGDAILIRGYLYPEGTWAANGCVDRNCGANPGGGPEYHREQIGVITCTGNFTSDPFAAFGQSPVPFGQEVGLFFLNLNFGDGSNMLELRGRTLLGFDGSHPAPFSITGGTGIFKNARGEALEIMIRPNGSRAFNFVIDLSGLRGVPRWQVQRLIGGY